MKRQCQRCQRITEVQSTRRCMFCAGALRPVDEPKEPAPGQKYVVTHTDQATGTTRVVDPC